MTNTLWCSFFGTICCYHRSIISKVVWRNYKHIQGLWSNESVYFWKVYQNRRIRNMHCFYSKLSSVLTAAFPDPLISTVMVTISLGCIILDYSFHSCWLHSYFYAFFGYHDMRMSICSSSLWSLLVITFYTSYTF